VAKIIKYDAAKMNAMIESLRTSAKQMRESLQHLDSLASGMIKDEKFIGPSADDLAKGMKNGLCRAMERLADKLDDRANLVERELKQMDAAAKN
jgi:hypothetical protein